MSIKHKAISSGVTWCSFTQLTSRFLFPELYDCNWLVVKRDSYHVVYSVMETLTNIMIPVLRIITRDLSVYYF